MVLALAFALRRLSPFNNNHDTINYPIMKKLILLGILSVGLSGHSIKPPTTIEVVIIVNPKNTMETLNPPEVREYWLKRGTKKRWKGFDAAVYPVDRKQKCPEKDFFYKKILDLTFDDVEAYFEAKHYQNAEAPPVKYGTDKEVINYVAEQAGAIGFVNKTSITSEVKPLVKIICTISE